jgi:chromosome segregation ATPase
LALDTKEDLALARLVASKTKAAGISNVEGVVSKVNEFDAKLEKVASTESEIESIRTRKESLTAAAGDPKKLEALQEKLEDELSDAQDVLSRKESEMKRISDRKRALDKLATLHERTETDVDTRVNKILSSIPGLKQYAEKSDKKEDDKEREDHSFRALTECELDNSRAGLKRLSDNAELVGQALNAVQSNQMRQDAEMEAIRAGNEAADAASTTCSAITDPKAAEAKLAEVAGQKKALEDQLTALKTQVGGAQQACMQESQQSKDKKAVPQSCAVANNASQGINVLRAQLRGPAAAFKSCSDRKDMLMLMAVGSAVNAENQQKMDLAKAYQAGAELLTKAAADAIAKANSTPAAAAAPTSLSPTPIINGGLGSSTGGYPSIRTRQGGNAGLGPRRSSPNGGSGSVRSRSASSLVAR